MSGRYSLNHRTMWRRKRDKYSASFFAVTTPKHPSPRSVVHLFSTGLDAGGPRYWAFRTKDQRDDFVRLYINAKACSDPCPAQ